MDCPVCHADQHVKVVRKVNVLPKKKVNLPLLNCIKCDHKFFFTLESDQKIIEEAYGDHYQGYRKDIVFEENLKKICNRFLRAGQANLQVLDVGCGRGDFLALSKSMGYSSLGIDVSVTARDICASRGLEAVAGDFLQYQFDKTFDVVTFWDVLEHLQFPEKFISRAAALLNDGGIILIKVPYFSKLSLLLASRIPVMARVLLGAPDHIQFYTKNSLKNLGNRSGFIKVRIESIGSIRGADRKKSFAQRFKKNIISFVKSVFGDGNYLVVLQKGSQ
jgi:SAM-dependent methyltransferase